eukprot:GHRR01000110.1.p1 GENE.GHRR01000110.1~~GHRR01000110.1.p1  ORF type:complete len:213 (+),score=94.51 GHRR01000110.1:158-796(+)
MKAIVLALALLLVLGAVAPSAANRQLDESMAQFEGAADNLLSQFMEMVSHMFGGSENDDQPPKTVAELAEHAPGNVSILINGVDRADLHNIIADPDFKATIFAPTNRAFEVALLKLKLTPAQLYADKTALTNILSYHTINGQSLTAADLKNDQELTTVSQHKLRVKVDKVAGTAIQGDQDTAKVVAADIKAGQSVIHVIDTVLLPPKPTEEL